jgi:hypothetical protein
VTLVVSRDVQGPATHALVIGVPYYRHLSGGEGPFLKPDFGLQQLDAPRPSVRELVAFLEHEYQNSRAPLATVDVLLPADPAEALPDDPTARAAAAAARPTTENVKRAIQEWFQRCTTSSENVALFYFCGHGLEGAEQYLLLEDFGAFPPSVLDNTLNLDRFYAGMGTCTAKTQLFFVDACREWPRQLEDTVPGSGQAVLTATLTGGKDRDAPTFLAAAKGRKAFAAEGQSTQFVQALLRALRGPGATQEIDGERWTVRYNSLAQGVAQLLANTPTTLPPQELRTAGDAGDALIHELPGEPQVPVVVLCDPETCAEITRLRLEAVSATRRYERDAAPGPWMVDAELGEYRLLGLVDAPYASQPRDVRVWPPMRRFKVTVTS